MLSDGNCEVEIVLKRVCVCVNHSENKNICKEILSVPVIWLSSHKATVRKKLLEENLKVYLASIIKRE